MTNSVSARSTFAPTRRQFVGAGLAAAAGLAISRGRVDASSVPTDSPDGTVNDGGTYTVTHDYGTFEIPANPQRVLAIENRRDLETAVVLGLPLVGVGVWGGGPNVAAPFVPVDLTGVEILNIAEPNTEAMLALAPDLILAREMYLDGDSEIAQVGPVLPIGTDGPWREDLQRAAGWLRREDMLGAALDQYDALRDEVAERHADALATQPVAIVEYFAGDGSFYAGGLDDFQLQANTLNELGGSLIPFLDGRSYFDEPFTSESLAELEDAKAILLVISNETDLDALADNELWQRLPAVAAGRVVTTDTRTNQGSVYAATECLRLLDELFATIG